MIACHSCGFEAPDDFAFCPKCATALAAPRAIPEERKVVTTLFCDLVAFTAMSENADPEDVDALLGDYFARATKVIESHGGTVEKFIGDAVVGVFGVPAVHEDDPERAVRAGLRILEALEGMSRPDGSPLQARCGVNTGEALVRLDVDPSSGRGFLTGDAVNVAARLEAAASPGGVCVGALTHELTSRVIDYEEMAAVSAKGKAEPVAAWRAVAPVSRRGIDTDPSGLSPFVGREIELAYLSATFDKVSAQATPHFVLVVGEPGIGKSRVVRELLAYVDSLPVMTTWRQGYCPPFGEDVTYWALSEMVKGHAGIRDTDDQATVEAKLESIVPAGVDEAWFRQRLRALVGLRAAEASREENSTAWMRFFEEVAASRPTVLVFEDLHWADEALLAFLEHLATHLASVPLMIVGTARPELFERSPGFAAGGRVSRVGLGPLSLSETTRLVETLLADDRSAVVGQVVARCDGNPFYAEQSARLLVDVAQERLPDSVQAVIAARLDGLPSDEKALLGDAAVVGSVFWDGAVAAIGDQRSEELDRLLSGLLRRGLIRRIRESSMDGEREYAFVHALARDVAYAQLPRGARARKHRAVAEWLAVRSGLQGPEYAERLTHHYLQAVNLAEAAKDLPLRDSLMEPLLESLEIAGQRALILDAAAAERHFARGLDLIDPADPRRARFLSQWAIATADTGHMREGIAALEEAIPVLQAAGDRTRTAEALMFLGMGKMDTGLPGGWPDCRDAVRLLDDEPPSLEKIAVLYNGALLGADLDETEGAVRLAERALEDADALGLAARTDDPMAATAYCGALMARGWARCHLGEVGGLEDMREASERSEIEGAHPLPTMNYAVAVSAAKGPVASLPLFAHGLDLLAARGLERLEVRNLANMLVVKWQAGMWDEALAGESDATERLQAASDVVALTYLKAMLALLHVCRGESAQALSLAKWCLERVAEAEERDLLSTVLVASSLAQEPVNRGAALKHLRDVPPLLGPGFLFNGTDCFPHMLRAAHLLGDLTTAERLTSWIDLDLPMHRGARAYGDALLAEARGEHRAAARFSAAAASLGSCGVPYEEAQSLLGQGRCLVSLGRVQEAAVPLAAARGIFARLGAKPALAETDGLMQQVESV